MKKIILLFALLLTSLGANAQHTAQIDGGTGNYGIFNGSLLPVGTTIFTMPPTGGTMLVSSSPFPSQAGHAGEFLTTDGTNLSWGGSVAASKAGIGSWYENGVGNNSVLAEVDVAGAGAMKAIIPPFPGNITGLSVAMENACTGGTMTATVHINNGPAVATVTITNGELSDFQAVVAGAGNAFLAGARITVKNTTAGYSPAADDMLATVFATF